MNAMECKAWRPIVPRNPQARAAFEYLCNCKGGRWLFVPHQRYEDNLCYGQGYSTTDYGFVEFNARGDKHAAEEVTE